jgi:hypothetical protein
MAKTKTLNMDKMKSKLKKTEGDFKDWKARIRQAVDDGEHKSADTAIKLLTRSRDSIQKLLTHVEGHATKKRPKADM